MDADNPIELRLGQKLFVKMPDDVTYLVQPGLYRKGICVQPVTQPAVEQKTMRGKRRGRRPHPATIALRERLAKDMKNGGLAPGKVYVDWLLDNYESVSLNVARSTVYREIRAIEAEEAVASST